jgi:hypothetical protein
MINKSCCKNPSFCNSCIFRSRMPLLKKESEARAQWNMHEPRSMPNSSHNESQENLVSHCEQTSRV